MAPRHPFPKMHSLDASRACPITLSCVTIKIYSKIFAEGVISICSLGTWQMRSVPSSGTLAFQSGS